MSSPSERFECRWQGSRRLLAAYALAQCAALLALWLVDVPWPQALGGMLACLAHAVWVVPRSVTLSHATAWRGLRRDANGWQLWSQAAGWQSVQLRPDTVSLPACVILRVQAAGQHFSRSICIASDALPCEIHRRLRLRLKFSRKRWAAPADKPL